MGEGAGGSLEVTPTWAFAVVCAALILVSFALERAIHYAGKWVKKRPEKSLDKALDKIKEELMVLGFISLLLAVLQPSIAKICMPQSFLKHLLPCKFNTESIEEEEPSKRTSPSGHSRRLMFLEAHVRRILAGGGETASKCYEKRKVPFVSYEAVHQLHIFIFVLAIGHVVYTCLTLLLARLKVHGWHVWERKAQSELVGRNAPPGGTLRKQSTFLRKYADTKWNSSPFLSWAGSFFRQFGRSVTFTEYQTLRRGFIFNHNLSPAFDFHKYMLSVVENDFKKVVGINGFLWLFLVIFVLLNIQGLYTYFWIGFIPLLLLFIVGAKLEHVILTLAVEIAEEQRSEHSVVINPRNDLFWFKRPRMVLSLLHFILFQNAFELAYFVWIWTTFGFHSCLRDKLSLVIARVVIGLIMLVLLSYSTLPLYALVTQMGNDFKFGENIEKTLLALSARAKAKARVKRQPSPASDIPLTEENPPTTI